MSRTAVHGSEADTLHDYVTWTTGSVKTYDEWKALSKDEQHGSYWVLADDGYAYWMQPLAPSGEEDTAGGRRQHRGCCWTPSPSRRARRAPSSTPSRWRWTLIDAKLAGLTDEGATWTSDAAKALAAAAVYDPVQDAVDRVDGCHGRCHHRVRQGEAPGRPGCLHGSCCRRRPCGSGGKDARGQMV